MAFSKFTSFAALASILFAACTTPSDPVTFAAGGEELPSTEATLKDSDFNKSNTPEYNANFLEHKFGYSNYIVFFATMDSMAVKGENVTLYFDGLWEQKDPKNYRYISIYYLPDDFDYNRGAISGGKATLAFRAPVKLKMTDKNDYPDNDSTLTHKDFSNNINDIIRTGLKWDGSHRNIMVVHYSDHTGSTVLMSKRSGKSLFFTKTPDWAAGAYNLTEIGKTFEIPDEYIADLNPMYSSIEGIFVTTKSGAVTKDDLPKEDKDENKDDKKAMNNENNI